MKTADKFAAGDKTDRTSEETVSQVDRFYKLNVWLTRTVQIGPIHFFQSFPPQWGGFISFLFKKEVARGGEQTRVLLISFYFSFSPLYR
jgi:hypothetical protein